MITPKGSGGLGIVSLDDKKQSEKDALWRKFIIIIIITLCGKRLLLKKHGEGQMGLGA